MPKSRTGFFPLVRKPVTKKCTGLARLRVMKTSWMTSVYATE